MDAQPKHQHQPYFQACPFLGRFDDSKTCHKYPSSKNFCHQLPAPQPISLNHQKDICLTPGQYSDCPIFSGQSPDQLPQSIRGEIRPVIPSSLNWKRYLIIFSTLLISMLVLLVLLLNGHLTNQQAESPALLPGPSNTATLKIVEIADVMPTSTAAATTTESKSRPTAAPSKTRRPTRTVMQITPTPTLASGDFLIHEVQENESLPIIASRYHTSTDLLIAINGMEEVSLWPGDRLIVQYHQYEQEEPQSYSAVEITRDTPLETILTTYQLPEERFWILNQHTVNHQDLIPANAWVIVEQTVEPEPED